MTPADLTTGAPDWLQEFLRVAGVSGGCVVFVKCSQILHRQRAGTGERNPTAPSTTATAGSWTPHPWMVRVAHGALWTLVIVAALSGLGGLARPGGSGTSGAARLGLGLPPEAAGVAEVSVANFLVRGEVAASSPQAATAAGAPIGGTSPVPPIVLRAAAVASHPVVDDYWAVVVAVDLVEPGAEPSTAALAFFEIGVRRAGEHIVAVGSPAQVAMPAPGPVPRRAGPELSSGHASDPAVATVEAFLIALLTGEGDAGRYVAPGARVEAITPPPYVGLSIEGAAVWGESDTRFVRIEIEATTSGGRTQALEYQLRLARRAGRWEVRSLSGAPELRSAPAAPSATSEEDT